MATKPVDRRDFRRRFTGQIAPAKNFRRFVNATTFASPARH
jgi:hypothetical protein